MALFQYIVLVQLVLVAYCNNFASGSAYVTFGGETLRNNSYVDQSRLGNDELGENSLQCHTDLDTCCGSNSSSSADWIAPDNNVVGESGAIYSVRGDQRIDLRRSDSGNIQSGIYRCEIETAATTRSNNVPREIVYVGLYSNGGGRLAIEGIVSLAVSPSRSGYTTFTFTCVTTGGPPTYVVWTTGTSLINSQSKSSVFKDAQTARYTHTLSLTGRILRRSQYICIIRNENSRVQAVFQADEIIVLDGIRVSSTSVDVSWRVDTVSVVISSVSLSLRNTNSTECFNHRDEISGIPVNQTNLTLTGLQQGTNYAITVTAHLNHGVSFSQSKSIAINLNVLPVAPQGLIVLETSPFTITFGWEPLDCKYQITAYLVRYGDSDVSEIQVNGTRLTLTELQSSTEYKISVAAINTVGIGPYSNIILTYTDDITNDDLLFGVESVSSTSATLSWSLAIESITVTSYSISLTNTNNTSCFTDSADINDLPGTITEYSLTAIHGGTEYTAILSALLSNGDRLQQETVFTTPEKTPVAAPEVVGVIGKTETNITLQWSSVDCKHQNGIITGYLVSYKEEGSGREESLTVTTHIAILSNLRPGTMYSIRVAAVNSAGEGIYSQNINVATHFTTSANNKLSPNTTTSSSETETASTSIEALAVTGGIGFTVGIAVTLLFTLSIICFITRTPTKKNRVAEDDKRKKEEEEGKSKKLSINVADNSAYCSTMSVLAGNSYQEEIIYEHIK